MGVFTWLVDLFREQRRQRVEVHLRVHRADLLDAEGNREDCYFLNVWNASPESRVQVTHVWVEASTGHVSYLNQRRPLPVTIEPRHQWETWIPASLIPAGTDVETAARAKLTDETIITSTAREDVPPAGMVPGAPVRAVRSLGEATEVGGPSVLRGRRAGHSCAAARARL